MDIALCRCGVDMTQHLDVEPWGNHYLGFPLGHAFEAAGTRHRCENLIAGYICPRPKYHQQEGVVCGPLTGQKLW